MELIKCLILAAGGAGFNAPIKQVRDAFKIARATESRSIIGRRGVSCAAARTVGNDYSKRIRQSR